VSAAPLADTRSRILIVEDDARLATLLGEYLRRAESAVVARGRGAPTIDVALANGTDVLVADPLPLPLEPLVTTAVIFGKTGTSIVVRAPASGTPRRNRQNR
jgi:DNA-binding NtrC family response regulator